MRLNTLYAQAYYPVCLKIETYKSLYNSNRKPFLESLVSIYNIILTNKVGLRIILFQNIILRSITCN